MSKIKTWVINLLVIAGVIGGLILIAGSGKSNKSENTAASKNLTLAATEEDYNFGEISMAQGLVSHNYAIKNESSEPLQIKSIYTSCMCTEAYYQNDPVSKGPYGMPGHGLNRPVNEIINPGQEAIIKIVFDPAAHGPAGVGRIQRTVTIESDKATPLVISFTAQVKP